MNPFWIVLAITAIASFGASYAAARKARKAAGKLGGDLLNKLSNIEGVPVIYGEKRVGGTIVFKSTKDAEGSDPNEYLYVLMVLCEGEVESITDIQIDGNPDTLPRYQVATVYRGTVHYGGDDQSADSDWITEIPHLWTSSHRLRGLAYVAFRFRYNNDAYYGEPEMTALVKGRKVYDPRKDSTNGGSGSHRTGDPSTWEWSDNPALCIRDYLSNARFGKGLSDAEINDTYFAQAATDCDTFVTAYTSGPSIKLFQCNIRLNTDETIMDNLRDLLVGCRGFLPFIDGRYCLVVDKSASSVMSINMDHIIADGGFSIVGTNKEKKFNRVICKFINANNEWQEDQASWPDAGSTEETNFIAEDGGTLLIGEFELTSTTSYYAARDLARIICLRSRRQVRCSFVGTSELLELIPGDVVALTHPSPGWSGKLFQVEEIGLNFDGTASVALLEYDSAIYSYDPANPEQPYQDTDLPDPFVVAAPSNFVLTETTSLLPDGTLAPAVLGTWDAPEDSFVEYYEAQGKKAADSEWNSRTTTTTNYTALGLAIGESYNFRVRAWSAVTSSPWVTANITLTGDTTIPDAPTGVAATAGYGGIYLTWTNSTDVDLAHVDVYESASNDSGTASKIGSVSGEAYTRLGLGSAVQRYYWLKSVDNSGNQSSFSSGVTATTLDAGLNGDSVDIVFRRSATQPSTPSPSPSTPSGWYSNVNSVPSSSDPLWSCVGQRAGGATDYTWETPILVEGQEGDAGADGLSVAEVSIYRRASSAPSTPTGGSFDFGTQVLTPPSSWSVSVPSGTDPVYISRAVASIQGISGTDSTLTWSTPVISFQNGANGSAGATGPRSATVYFFCGLPSASTPTAPDASQVAYNFSTSTATVSLANWSNEFDPAALSSADGANNKFWAVRVIFQENTFGGTYTETIVGPFVWTNFDGLVTFTNLAQGRDANGDISTTLIDGGSITADTLNISRIRSNTSKTYGPTNGFQYEMGTSTQVAGYAGAGLFRVGISGFAMGALANSIDSFAFGGQQAANSSTAYAAALFNSTSLGGTTHRTSAVLCNNTRAAFFQDSGRNVAFCNGTYAVATVGDVYVDGDITATGSISPFTGSHDGLMPDTLTPDAGDIMVDVSIVARKGLSDTLALMGVSDAPNLPAIGVFVGVRPEGYVPSAIRSVVQGEETAPGVFDYDVIVDPDYAAVLSDRLVIGVNSVGEGQVNVCGENGDILAGDLIVTSSMPGKGMKQGDDIVKAKTVAKARESAAFTDPSEVKQIACIYLCG